MIRKDSDPEDISVLTIENKSLSSPPLIDQVTSSVAKKEKLASLIFSFNVDLEFLLPPKPEGPRIFGGVSSISPTIIVTF